jgi:hypothetical protein
MVEVAETRDEEEVLRLSVTLGTRSLPCAAVRMLSRRGMGAFGSDEGPGNMAARAASREVSSSGQLGPYMASSGPRERGGIDAVRIVEGRDDEEGVAWREVPRTVLKLFGYATGMMVSRMAWSMLVSSATGFFDRLAVYRSDGDNAFLGAGATGADAD